MANFVQHEIDALAVAVAEKVLAALEPKLQALISAEVGKVVGKL